MRETVARAIHAAEFHSSYDEDIDEYERELNREIADAAIAAVLDDLIAEADDNEMYLVGPGDYPVSTPLAEWLVSKQGQP